MKGEFLKASEKAEVFSSALLYQRWGGGGAGMSWEFIHFDYLSDSWSVTDRQGRSRHYLNPRPLKMSFVLMRWRIAH